MRSAFATELIKLRTTKTAISLFLAMLGLVLLAVLLHGFGLSARDLSDISSQNRVLMAGETVGAVFSALLGAMAMTAEIRHGTIRPTFLGIPRRDHVLRAKALSAAWVGLVFGLAATGVAALAGSTAFSIRGIDTRLTGDDYVQLIVGGAVASALWAVIGLGVGSLVRNQVTAIIGLFLWLQIVENLLIDSVPSVSQYMPGSLAQAVAGGQTGTVDSSILALVLLMAYAAAALLAGTAKTLNTDFA